MSDPKVITFGCRLNIFESEVIRGHAVAAGLSDTIIVHTCAVTAEAERQARQAIRRAKRENPHSRIIVTGCSVQIAPDRYTAMEEIDAIVGNQDKLLPTAWAKLTKPGSSPIHISDIMAVRQTTGHLVSGFDGRTRAFVQVQNGCDHRCTFCIIPYGRGNSRSVPIDDVVDQVRLLVENGYQEVVITGVDITSYGKDLEGTPPLGYLLDTILKSVPELPRLRLSSIDPAEVDEQLFELITSEPRLMPHVHLSLQAGDNMVLKRMKRRHGRDDVLKLCHKLRSHRSDIVFGADMIAGFPTEDDEMFERSRAMVGDAGLTFLHVFPYSPRPNTPAARMPQVPKTVRRERAARLRAEGEAALNRFLRQQVGQRRQVLVERGGHGHTQHFAPVRVGADVPAGVLSEVDLASVDDGILVGRCVA